MKYVKTVTLALLVAALTLTGCSQKTDTKPSTDGKGAAKEVGSKADHAPHGQGPNGGVVFDLGKYHAEFTVDHDRKQCMVVVLGSDEKTPTAVAASDLTLTTKETKTKEGMVVPPMTIT